MNTINSSNMAFKSVIVPKGSKEPLIKYFDALQYCNLKSLPSKSVEKGYGELISNAKHLNQYDTGIILGGEPEVTMRFLGYSKEDDKYIYEQLKKVDDKVIYVDDVPNDGTDNKVFNIVV